MTTAVADFELTLDTVLPLNLPSGRLVTKGMTIMASDLRAEVGPEMLERWLLMGWFDVNGDLPSRTLFSTNLLHPSDAALVATGVSVIPNPKDEPDSFEEVDLGEPDGEEFPLPPLPDAPTELEAAAGLTAPSPEPVTTSDDVLDGFPFDTADNDDTYVEAAGDDFEPDVEIPELAELTIPEVKDFVEANPGLAAAVADAERAGKGRLTLLSWLANFTEV